MTEEERNIGIVKRLYDAYKRHDISSVLDMFTDDAVLHGPAPAGVLPWGGIYNGRGGAAEFFRLLASHLNLNSLSCGTLLPKATRL
jgi:ketosteroid isomerase-like protein